MEQGIDVIIEDDEIAVDSQPDFLKGDKGDKGDKRRQGREAEIKGIKEIHR